MTIPPTSWFWFCVGAVFGFAASTLIGVIL